MTDSSTKRTIRLDAYTIIDTAVTGLTVLLGGLAVFSMAPEVSGPAALILVTLITMGNKLLGKSAQTTIEDLNTNVKVSLAQVSVFRTDASASLIRKAEEAGEAVRTNSPPPPA